MIEHCFLDLDGVLVDFVQGALDVHNFEITVAEMYKNILGEWDFVKHLSPKMTAASFWKPMNEEFWAKLEWMDDGREIVRVLEDRFGQKNITLWTTSSDNYGCAEGKKRWVERHLPKHYKHNIIFGHAKHFGAAKDTILVDDRDLNIDKFAERGGNTLLVPRLWNKLHEFHTITTQHMMDVLYDKQPAVGLGG